MLKKIIYLFTFLVVLFSSCVRYKNITYMQDRYNNDSVNVNLNIETPEDIILENGNNLYIKLSGIEGYQVESFEKGSSGNSNYTELMLYFQGYLIADDGNVDLPVVGKIQVAGKSFKEAKKLIQERYSEFLKGVIVDIRLVSYDVTLLGEVRSPGKYVFYKPNTNVLEALARGGNLTNYGDAKNIVVIRDKGEHSESVMIDLTSTDLFKNTHFWLEPGDVIYVKPLRAKMFSVNAPTINLFFSTVSLIIVVLTFIQTAN